MNTDNRPIYNPLHWYRAWGLFMRSMPIRPAAAALLAMTCAVQAADIVRTDSKDGKTRLDLLGEIESGDANKLKEIVAAVNGAQRVVATIRLDSPGGNLLEGVAISAIVKFGRISTSVLGDKTCTSACFIVFAAGSEKFANYTARVGVHGASNARGDEAGDATITMSRVLRNLGVPPSILGKLVVTPPHEMVWLTVDDLRSMNVAMFGKPQQVPLVAQAPAQQLPPVAQMPAPDFQPVSPRSRPSVSTNAPAQSNRNSANSWMPGCRAVVDERNTSEMFSQGRCMGALIGLAFSDPKVCPPPQSTHGQNVKVVIHYIDSRPARLHEDFLDLATEALRDAWPCRR